MISRLQQVEVTNFRRIRGTHKVPLDGGIVVIYGANGSGKTSLFQSLEYAITGSVSDLAGFADYERVLQNQFSSEAMSVHLTCRDISGESLSLLRGLNDTRGPGLDAESRRYFQERSYLSQRQLTRLLEHYQARGGDEDQLLATFIQRLLQLDELMNLSDGLHAGMDRRRLKKKVKQLEVLENREKELAASISAMEQRVIVLRQQTSELIETVARTIRTIGMQSLLSLIPEVGVSDFSERAEQLRLSAAASLFDVQQQGQLNEQRLAHVRTVGSLAGSETGDNAKRLDAAEKPLMQARETLTQREAELSRARQEVAIAAEPFQRAFGSSLVDLDDLAYIREVDRLSAQRLAQSSASLERVDAAASRVETLGAELAAIDADTKVEINADEAESVARLLGLLRPALQSIGDSHCCPVCLRDYAETGQGDLAELLRARIRDLEAASNAAVERERRNVAAAARRSTVSQELEELNAVLKAEPCREATAQEVEHIVLLRSAVVAAASACRSVEQAKKLVEAEQTSMEAIERDVAKRHEARGSMAKLQDELGLPSVDGLAFQPLLAELTTYLNRERAQLGERRDGLEGVLESVRTMLKGTTELEEGLENLARLKEDLSSTSERLKSVDRIERIARKVADSSSKARRDALVRAIQGDLNGLWEDLFVRLVPTEQFIPQMSAPLVIRKRLHVSTQVKAPGLEPLESEPTLSAGNLNTAALCLFLAMNMVVETKMPVLLLDDPIQSMDDVHLVNFAGLISGLARDAKRQVIVGVHEKALYDYLIHQLGPTRPGDRTIGVELAATSDGHWDVEPTVYTWSGDQVQVKLAAQE